MCLVCLVRMAENTCPAHRTVSRKVSVKQLWQASTSLDVHFRPLARETPVADISSSIDRSPEIEAFTDPSPLVVLTGKRELLSAERGLDPIDGL